VAYRGDECGARRPDAHLVRMALQQVALGHPPPQLPRVRLLRRHHPPPLAPAQLGAQRSGLHPLAPRQLLCPLLPHGHARRLPRHPLRRLHAPTVGPAAQPHRGRAAWTARRRPQRGDWAQVLLPNAPLVAPRACARLHGHGEPAGHRLVARPRVDIDAGRSHLPQRPFARLPSPRPHLAHAPRAHLPERH